MKYLDLFAGIGGFSLGIQQAYERLFYNQSETSQFQTEQNISSNNGNKFQGTPLCIGYSEIDKYAIKIYERHFPDHTNFGDITKINAEELPDFDLVVGGFPCQSFSIAGKRGGFADTRGTLFFDIARIIKTKRPALLLLENVKGLLSHGEGSTFITIICTLDELGYDIQWQVLNSKNFGVPQNRERVFIVGHLRGTPRPEVFPFGAGNEVNPKQDAQGNDIAHTIQCGDKHRGSYVKVLGDYNHRIKENGIVGAVRQTFNNSKEGNGCKIIDGMRIRRLTPTECERLQGFPDSWTDGVSDTQRYKVLGNAITTFVVKEIMIRLLHST